MTGLLRTREFLKSRELGSQYDVVIVGGGGHGLATAYYLASRFGIRRVAVLERDYIGAGSSGRNTTVLRANYKMPESVRFFKASLEMYRTLSSELDFNLLVTRRGLFWLAHSTDSLRLQRERSFLNRALDVETNFIDPTEIKSLCPQIDLEAGSKGRPILGAAYHPSGSVVRHDAVVWGYAAAAQKLGVEIHEGTGVVGLRMDANRVVGVETTKGFVSAGTVVSAVAGNTSTLASFARLRLPITTHPLQAFVTEPYKPILNRIVASADFLVYVSQTTRGEILVGAEIDPYTSYSTRSSFSFLAHAAARTVDLLPFTRQLRILRQWAGICDMSPDYSPLIGPTEAEGFIVSGGWGTWGFKAIPAAALGVAELVATGTTPDLIRPFRIDRFRDDEAIPDRSSAGTH